MGSQVKMSPFKAPREYIHVYKRLLQNVDVNNLYTSQKVFSIRHNLAAHWLNTHDLHSALAHFRWWAGTTPGGEDVHPASQLHLVDSISIQVSTALPSGITIYITVKAVDLAGK